MNVFLDSCILFEDYFFENNSNKKLLDYAKDSLITLYMAEIVRFEFCHFSIKKKRWRFKRG